MRERAAESNPTSPEADLRARLAHQGRRLRLYQSIAQAIIASSDIEEIFRAALQGLHAVIPYHTASIVRVLEGAEEVEIIATAGERPIDLVRGKRIAYPVRATLEVLERDGVLLRDYDAQRSPAERILVEAGFRCGIWLPLIAQEETLGILHLAHKTPGSYDPEVADELRPVAAQVAAGLRKQSLLDESRERGRMLESLAQQIASMNAELEERVAERTQELERAYNELKELDRAKTVFLTTVSHELKTPLVTVAGYLEMALAGRLGPLGDQQRRAFETALRNARRLDHLVEDVLDLARLELGRARVEPVPFELEPVVQDALASVALDIQGKGLRVEKTRDLHGIWVLGQPQRIGQVLTNLLANAVKFTEGGKRISVEVDPRGDDTVEIAVGDEGMGIPPEHHERIFESFYQVESGPTRRFGGAGLGLAIVRSILQAHGTDISLSSEPGRGARFAFRLPRAAPADRDLAPATPRERPRPQRVLVVEDEAEIREFVQIVLEMDGYEVVQARNGSEALAQVSREPPDLILLDISMAGLSGIEVCQRLKADPGLSRIPVYILSARTGEEDRHHAMAAGADGFVRKPFTPDELLRTLAEGAPRGAPR